jgi:hypothetical protein
MAHRTFVEEVGRAWQVWDTRPVQRGRAGVAPDFADGWLGFEAVTSAAGGDPRSGEPRAGSVADVDGPDRPRRLAPIPPGWEALPDAALVGLLARARPAARHSRPG